MLIPSTQEIRKPLLEAFRDEAPHSFLGNEFLEIIAESLGENLDELSTNDKSDFKNNINKAKTYLKRHGFLSMPSKGTYMITRKGSQALESDFDFMNDEILTPTSLDEISAPVTPVAVEEPEVVDEVHEEPETEIKSEINEEISQDIQDGEDVEDFSDEEEQEEEEENNSPSEAEIIENDEEKESDSTDEIQSPDYIEEEAESEEEENEESNDNNDDNDSSDINEAFSRYNSELADKVLSLISKIPSDKFERLVIDLLSKMGYFAFLTSRYNSRENDLIHGVIIDHENPGATPIYIQALKSSPEKTISRSDMQEFIKILVEKSGRGIFATLANFSEQAALMANNERVILIDGKKLASLMVSNNFCVNVEKVFEVKAIDFDSLSDYEG